MIFENRVVVCMKLHENIAARVMREMPPFKEAEQLLDLVQTHFFSLCKPCPVSKGDNIGQRFPGGI